MSGDNGYSITTDVIGRIADIDGWYTESASLMLFLINQLIFLLKLIQIIYGIQHLYLVLIQIFYFQFM